jgi:DNA-binding PadR family transcriptional regulator
MLRNNLKLIVMNKLKEESLSGYDLIKEIYNSTGSWKPSFGSMYPLLKELHKNKLVSIKVVNRKKVYSLTAQGIKVLEEALNASQDTIKMMLKEFKIMENICTPLERKHTAAIITEIQKNSLPFININEELDSLHKIIFRLNSNGKLKTKEKEIKKIFNEAIINLRKI